MESKWESALQVQAQKPYKSSTMVYELDNYFNHCHCETQKPSFPGGKTTHSIMHWNNYLKKKKKKITLFNEGKTLYS